MALHFSQDQFKQAQTVSALEYARSRGYDLVPHCTGKYHLREHDSMVFSADGSWYWNSRGIHGRALDFMINYEGMTYPEAVLTLCDALPTSSTHLIKYASLPTSATVEKVDFQLPEAASNMRAAFAYLVKTRALDPEIIQELVRNHQIYQTDKRFDNGTVARNVVFVGLDENMNPRSAFERGCHTGSSFKFEVPGSCKDYPFIIYGSHNSKNLYIFEAAIDAISHASYYKMHGLDWKNGHRIAQGGNAPATAIFRMLRLHPEIETVKICTDNDTAGAALGANLKAALIAHGFVGTIADEHCPSEFKDWNEYLVIQKRNLSDSLTD